MGIATGMKDIAKDIASSYDLRMAEVKGLKKEANEMLGSFKASQDKMGAQLRKDLARDKAKMRGEVKTMRNGFQTSHKEMRGEVKAMRSGFQSSREEMSSALTKDLAEHTQGVRGEVARLRQEIGASHQDMSAKLRKNLARGAAALKSEAHAMLNGFQGSHKQMGAQLRKDLASYDHGIKSEVSGMRQETIADLKEARTAWQGLGSTMQAKRGGTKTPPKVAAPAAKEEIPDLDAKLLAAVNEHREGMTLAESANILGVAPVVLGRVSRKLLEKRKIRKNKMLYFPVSAK
jgi:hypothetical protein